MKKHLYLIVCIAVLLALAAGCSYRSSGIIGTGSGSTETSSPGSSIPGTVSDNPGQEAGSIASEGSDSDESFVEHGTGGVRQIEAADKAVTNLEPTAFEKVNGFDGISMSVRKGTASTAGLTLVFKNVTDSKCVYGEYFILEKKIGESWYQVPVVCEGEYGFDSIGYNLDPEGESERTLDWGWLYGSLEPGEYRVVKDILDFREAGDYDKYFLAAEFVL